MFSCNIVLGWCVSGVVFVRSGEVSGAWEL